MACHWAPFTKNEKTPRKLCPPPPPSGTRPLSPQKRPPEAPATDATPALSASQWPDAGTSAGHEACPRARPGGVSGMAPGPPPQCPAALPRSPGAPSAPAAVGPHTRRPRSAPAPPPSPARCRVGAVPRALRWCPRTCGAFDAFAGPAHPSRHALGRRPPPVPSFPRHVARADRPRFPSNRRRLPTGRRRPPLDGFRPLSPMAPNRRQVPSGCCALSPTTGGLSLLSLKTAPLPFMKNQTS